MCIYLYIYKTAYTAQNLLKLLELFSSFQHLNYTFQRLNSFKKQQQKKLLYNIFALREDLFVGQMGLLFLFLYDRAIRLHQNFSNNYIEQRKNLH